MSQESCLLGDLSYHEYQGIVIDPEEKETLARDLGPVNKDLSYHEYQGIVIDPEEKETLARDLGPVNKVRFFIYSHFPCSKL